ncbi:MAG: methylated-DNA--[protein]-cysteine S-methyltransferase [Flavobacteriaceae bacterium]
MKDNDQYIISTPLGNIALKANSSHVTGLRFVEQAVSDKKNNSPIVQQTEKQIEEYFTGERKQFDLPLNPEGTEFQKRIWSLLLKIPFGSTLSYLKLAQLSGNVRGIRAVAAAVGKNPILILIPCHRIIGSNGKMIGYAGGIQRKENLLNLEKVNPQKSLF